MLNDNVLDTEFIDDEYQKGNDFFYDDYEIDEDNSSSSSSSSSNDNSDLMLKKSRFIGEANKYRFFKRECEIYEFSRTPISFRLGKDNTDYKGIVLKELDKTHFIFLLDEPIKKMKKIDITDISVYF